MENQHFNEDSALEIFHSIETEELKPKKLRNSFKWEITYRNPGGVILLSTHLVPSKEFTAFKMIQLLDKIIIQPSYQKFN
ncbi:unnamed protein product [Blepharisma stoltei]|uniref:Uncharacterized protein n=1 Tax=Blepharisma stoltei TaxID=1481888 RepID=A0AAU9JPB4_9CILI|nr:unnamed protein product [Blepharisma stoltei]